MNEKQHGQIQAKLDSGETLPDFEVERLHEDGNDPDVDEEKFQNWLASRNQ